MAKLLKLRRGTTTQHASFTGAEGEVTIDTTKDTAVVHDGSQAGGRPMAREDMSNVSSASIAGQLGTDSIATTKIAAGALPTDVTVASANLVDGTIVNADVNASAAIEGSKLQASSGSVAGTMSSANFTKLAGIETAATADQTNAEIRTAVEAASDSNVFTDADHSKLNGIEAGATANMSNNEIRDAVEGATNSNTFTDADHSKLNGIEASATADQTGAEIVSALNGQNVYTTANIGRSSNDHIVFTADSRLDVVIAGNNEFRFEADGDFHADGDIIAQSTTISSDIRLKENIQVVPDALDKVESLRGVTFDWKRDGTPSAGVIAQEVQEVLPEAVKEVQSLKGGDSHLSVNYHALTSILIEAIKELKAEIEELKGGA